jgi:hypothetical protein
MRCACCDSEAPALAVVAPGSELVISYQNDSATEAPRTMRLFSQRKGLRPAEKAFQLESMDDDLRNLLWTALELSLWRRWSAPNSIYGGLTTNSETVESVARLVWTDFLKLPLDSMPSFDPRREAGAYQQIRTWFFEGLWWARYDLIEFLARTCPVPWDDDLCAKVNVALESENAAYRIVAGEVVQITVREEVEAVEEAIKSPQSEVRTHLQRALELLSDRKGPDYRNSIKESISAVEAVCRSTTGSPTATLGDCIKVLKKNGSVHPAFEQALTKLYGYTSDSAGIRHSLTEDGESPSYPEAKFMLVACSAFTSFITAKMAKTVRRAS